MALPAMKPPNIRLLMEGILLLSIDKVARPHSCKIGIVNLPVNDGHGLQLSLVKSKHSALKGPTFELLEVFDRNTIENATLDLVTTGGTGIQYYQDQGQGPNDFRWVLNFENPEVYGEEVLVLNALRSIVTISNINSGLFYVPVDGLSQNKLKIHIEGQQDQLRPVAVKIAANFPMTSDAVFTHGKGSLKLPKQKGVTYLITIAQSRALGQEDPDVNDADLYDYIIDGNQTDKGQISYAADPPMMHQFGDQHMFVPPDAACFTGVVSQEIT